MANSKNKLLFGRHVIWRTAEIGNRIVLINENNLYGSNVKKGRRPSIAIIINSPNCNFQTDVSSCL